MLHYMFICSHSIRRPLLVGNNIPATRAPQLGFELATNCVQFFAIGIAYCQLGQDIIYYDIKDL